MKKAVIITGQNFQDEEFIYPFYRLQEAGFKVDVAIKDKVITKGKYGVPAKPTVDTKDLKESDYDLVVLPGGHEAPDRVRQIKEVLDFVKAMHSKGKIISTICHGPWILISAGIAKGKKISGYIGIKDDIINAGAEYIDAPVVVDGNIISSPHYKYNGDWMRETLKKF
ncbi:MAG: peptidase C56 [Elusimicrobia bacterium RIFOXYC2_FULL_34_12]|nr:MAG: peptidase C56 [Elusimicrobia bacterium RIFOXYC2_FULL_34_12]OGS38250.1 MAG: peptidase C56 [Elusimicrobia bacterium RIFOXYD2_FULL_34_30]HAM38792.1 peptidase C56 [Elusimicrobiota bacterium]